MVRGSIAKPSATQQPKQSKPIGMKGTSKMPQSSAADQCTQKAIHCGKKPGGPVCLGCGATISGATR